MSGQGTLKEWSLKKVNILINGNKIEGYGSDGAVKVEFPPKYNDPTIGADGEHTKNENLSRTCKITLSLGSLSDSKRLLKSLVKSDIYFDNFTLIIQDLLHDTLFHTNTAYILGQPPLDVKQSVVDDEWEMTCANFIDG